MTNHKEYLAFAEATLDAIESALDASGAEVEYERNGNVLTLEFEDGSKIIVNLQAAMQEIWLAAKAGGFHYRQQDGAWLDTRNGTELFAALSRYASEQAGVTIELSEG
ncbi:iron donor protein CyaY [Mycoavidus sp. SF9855]|uniref:iron donor protein CyaY n=1 Tax=Mycoavidus sp. SF9855 TaxID=2968475 RepID=UPI00211C589E|nr:iron donor protein CyaY [Mycoavidus sp. SF9855]UUM21786.1 iron donor protein CyaY [Mycoavidus sp. SF9855]